MNTKTYKPWKPDELEILRTLYSKTTWPELESILGREKISIRQKAIDLGLRRERQITPIGWERKIGRHLMRRIALTGVRKLDWKRVDVIEWEMINGPVPEGMILAKPTKQCDGTDLHLVSIETLPMLASLNRMSPEMRNLIQIKARLNYALTRIEKLNPDQAIEPKTPKKYTNRPNSWRAHEIDYLRENYLYLDNMALAKSLGRTPRGVERQLLILGMARPQRNGWSKEDDTKLLSLYVTTSITELMQIFRRTKPAIYQRAKRLGLEKAKA